jgi:hypothetical protein
MKCGISKNEIKQVFIFWNMPCEILHLVSSPPTTLRISLEVFTSKIWISVTIWWFFTTKIKQGVCHTVALPLKHILRQKKNYKNSNISPCKTTILKKPSERNQNSSRYYDSVTNLKFQHKPKYRLSKILE